MSNATGALPLEPRPPRAGKSSAAFRTISEVSEELDVPQHVLRFWETKFAQVRPMKRAGGRRYYRPEDVVLLRAIRDLLYRDGFTIRGAQKLLRESGAKGVAAAGEAPLAGAAAQRSQAPENGDIATAPAAAAAGPAAAREAAIDRRALEAMLEELEALRDLLRARLGEPGNR